MGIPRQTRFGSVVWAQRRLTCQRCFSLPQPWRPHWRKKKLRCAWHLLPQHRRATGQLTTQKVWLCHSVPSVFFETFNRKLNCNRDNTGNISTNILWDNQLVWKDDAKLKWQVAVPVKGYFFFFLKEEVKWGWEKLPVFSCFPDVRPGTGSAWILLDSQWPRVSSVINCIWLCHSWGESLCFDLWQQALQPQKL